MKTGPVRLGSGGNPYSPLNELDMNGRGELVCEKNRSRKLSRHGHYRLAMVYLTLNFSQLFNGLKGTGRHSTKTLCHGATGARSEIIIFV
jgi:hypothetical protein